MSSIKEYFLLSDARSDAKRIPEDGRRELARVLGLARPRALAAEALWSNGHAAEGLAMLADAFQTTLRAISTYCEASGSEAPARETGWEALLEERGMGKDRVEELLSTQETVRDARLPALDGDLSSVDGDLFQKMSRARHDLEDALAPVAMTPAELRATGTWRIAFAGAAVVALAIGAYVVLHSEQGIEAAASAIYSPEFPASNVIDGQPESEWCLPDGQEGWVEVRIEPPERVDTFRLLNSHNRQYNDRATERYRVDFFVDGAVARTVESSFEEFQVRPEWAEHTIGVDGVERIRVEVLSHHRVGGGLAEMEWR
mgnify:CR=1 FL=1